MCRRTHTLSLSLIYIEYHRRIPSATPTPKKGLETLAVNLATLYRNPRPSPNQRESLGSNGPPHLWSFFSLFLFFFPLHLSFQISPDFSSDFFSGRSFLLTWIKRTKTIIKNPSKILLNLKECPKILIKKGKMKTQT